LYFPADIIRTNRPDGAYLVTPGRAVVMEEELSTKEVAKRFNLSRRRVQQIARELGARQRKRGCKLRIPASMVARELARLA